MGRSGSASQPARACVVLGRHVGHVDPGGGAVGGGHREGDDLARARAPGALHGHADPLAGRHVGLQPGRHPAGGEPLAVELEALLGDLAARVGVDGVHQSGAQLAAELQLVEELEPGGAVPRLAGQLAGSHGQGQVTDQCVEPPVADDVAEVLAQRLALLAGDLVGPGDDVVQPVELVDPLRGVALAHTGHARQVVGGLTDDGRELGVAVGRHAVLVLDVRRGEASQVADPAHRVEHGGGLGHELDGVAVTGEDQHLHALGHGLGGERRDDVVGLVAVELHVRDVERVEDPLDQRQLAAELPRRLVALGLVLGVLLEAEGLARLVEGDRDVGRDLVPQHVDQHRGEPVDGVGVLPRSGGEVLHRQGEERAVGQRVAVEEQEPGARGIRLRHVATLAAATDSRTSPSPVVRRLPSAPPGRRPEWPA